MSKKIFAVGDIHGCYEKLAAMMKILPWDKDNGDVSALYRGLCRPGSPVPGRGRILGKIEKERRHHCLPQR